MNEEKKIEQLVLTCIDTAKEMLKEYKIIIPFGIRNFNNSEDMKMNCPGDGNLKVDTLKQVDNVVSELKEYLQNEDIFATAFVTELEAGEELGIGLQIETTLSSVLFVYPYRNKNGEWEIDEPIQTEQLLTKVF